MAEDTTPPATPPAEQGGQKEEVKTFTQAQIDEIIKERLGRDRQTREEALAKDLGMPLKDVKAMIRAKKEAEEAAKSELEKLTADLAKHQSDAQVARIEAVKLRALIKAGAAPDKIDALLKRVIGSTPEEIEADVKELQSLGLIQPAGMGGSVNPANQAKEPTIDEQIKAAEKAGNIPLAISLKLKKQGLG
jgi:DNA-binding transcriptional MerR regulator